MNSAPRYAVAQIPTGRRRSLLERIRPGATVLDIGCWSGWAGAFLQEERGATVDGVEPDGDMAAMAAERYRDVAARPAEDVLSEMAAERPGEYGHVLLLDVLEHLQAPELVLREAARLLSADGSALVSVPNVAHWSVRKELALGRWHYEDSGLLDRTHLRFYTRASAHELLASTGFEVEWESVSVGQPPLVRVPDRWLSVLERWPTMFGVQMLFEARPQR